MSFRIRSSKKSRPIQVQCPIKNQLEKYNQGQENPVKGYF